jgi:sec-independent protein translocase protein TatB
MGFNSNFSFLGIGIPELVFIIMLALVVLGPERLPTVAKDLIRAFFKVRNLSKDLTGQLEAELGLAEIKELKGIKTGKLIEDWANDELDLNFDEDDENRKASAKSKTKKALPKKLSSAPKSKAKAALPKPDEKPEKTTQEETSTEAVAHEALEVGTQEVAAATNDITGVQRVESQNVIGSAHTIGTHPGSPTPEMNGNAAAGTGMTLAAEDLIATSDSVTVGTEIAVPTPMGTNGVVSSTKAVRASRERSAPKLKDRWWDTMERRRQLRIQNGGRSKRIDGKGHHPGIQRSRLRKQSPAVRARAR